MRLNLRTRIYLSMLAVILISFLATGITAYYNYRDQNEDYHNSRLQRKEEAVASSLSYFLEQNGGYISPDSITQVFSDKVCELSDIHAMPINFFDLRGNLAVSSTPTIFDEKNIPEQINYTILKQLSTGNNRAVITADEANNEYLIAYWYLRDRDEKPIAITSVAYFDTQSENKKELEGFLYRLGQIYIILIIGTSVLAYFLSNYITQSLTKIRDRLRSVRLSEKNEPLVWKGNDEIGALVKEYNHMLLEVEKSAKMLAKSERESAWREMAKQVAHEIKNPLTPMKLRVQHLKQAWQDKSVDFDDRLKKVSDSLIEQIEALSNIATEFSNFAKMPRINREEMDLTQTIQASKELYRDLDNASISFKRPGEEALTYGDREQLLRVFNNLIKNAIQAIPDGRKGKIEIRLHRVETEWEIEIQDNGVGISEGEKESIFVPNFTTKSAGMGLGLAMVQSIVHHHSGRVWFESEKGKGSSFFVRLPLLKVPETVN